jgi:tetratricopeptide (TPR) repeat protein
MRRNLLSLSLLLISLVFVSAFGWSQARPGGSGNTGTTAPPTNSPSPSTPSTTRPSMPNPNSIPGLEVNRPIFLRGKVVLDQGGEISEPVPIQRVCGSSVQRDGYTDMHGNFSITIGDNTNFQDASESGTFGARSRNVTPRQLWNCEIRAMLPGYTSSAIPLAGHDFNDISSIGNIVLHKIGGNTEGNSVSVTSLKAPDKAKNEYKKALEAYDEKKYSDVEKHLGKALDTYPQYAAAWDLRGRAQQKQQQEDNAIKSYESAIAADAKFVSPYIRLASVYSGKNDWAQVVHLTEQAIQLDPLGYPDAYLLNGAAHYNLKQYPEAERSAAKALSLDHDHRFPRAELLMGSLLQMRGEIPGAAEHLRNFLKFEPNATEAASINVFLTKYDQQTASAAKPTVAQPKP